MATFSTLSNKDCEIPAVCKNVVLAWGSRNFCAQGMNRLNKNLKKFLKYCNKNTNFYTLIENKTRHPGRQAWRGENGLDYAELHDFIVRSFDKLKIVKGGEL